MSTASNASHTAGPTRAATAARSVALAVGAVFLLVGVLGFVPGITTHYGDLSFMGHESGAKLLGIFQVSILHNIVHLAFGVVGIAVAARPRSAVAYLVVGGLIYLVLWIYGLSIGMGSTANFVPVNDADNWLHLVLGVAMVALGLGLQRMLKAPLTRDEPV